MKQYLSLMIAVLMLSACGKGGSPAAPQPAPNEPDPITCSTLEGIYDNTLVAGATLTVAGDCSFTDSICGYDADYTIPDRDTGATTITVNGTNGTPGCMSSTAHACEVGFNGDDLTVTCDSGAVFYSFDKR